jgi:ABC-type lipoprotein release transport system permease subunit
MHYLLEISRTGLAAVLLHRLRSFVCVVALVAVILPYLVCLGLARGIEAEAEASANFGADLYLSGVQLGRPAPVPLSAVSRISALDGVERVVPRIVGEVIIGKDKIHAILVGLPPEQFANWAGSIVGELPRPGGANQLVVGSSLARRLGLEVGSVLPPFYRNDRLGDRLSMIVGTFRPDAPLWQANLMLTTFDTASAMFDQQDLATDLLIWCRPGYEDLVTRGIMAEPGLLASKNRPAIGPRVTAREDLLALLPQGLLHREGIFNLHFVLAFVVGILVLLVTSGLGLAERRREIGILKATGWQTDEILLRGFVESFCLSLAGACAALLLAWVWLRLFNGYGIAALFLAGVDAAPDFPVPFRLTPIPALLCFVLSFAIVLTGTLYSSWRAAVAPPREAIR